MIKRLKLKFVILAMLSLFILLSVIVAGMNIMNYSSVVVEADEILAFLSENNGTFPDKSGKPVHGMDIPKHFSPETPYETRFFTVMMNETGRVIDIHTEQIISVDKQAAEEYALTVLEGGESVGFIDDYRYRVSEDKKGKRITFLDCGRKLEAFDRFMFISVFMSFVGFAVVSVIIIIFSEKIIKPVSQSYEKQKRFITDAGHELKTPLTIINANVDLLEADPNDAECINDIRQQTQRLASLTNNLVYLAQLDEKDGSIEKFEIPFSDIVSETVSSFRAIAQAQSKELVCNIQPMLTVKGNHEALKQLVAILTDNALKYSPEESRIEISLKKRARGIEFTVSNITSDVIARDKLEHVFDRFYRMENSRNSETGGHGIGLSSAEKIVEAHNGKIRAFTTDGTDFNIVCLFR